MANDAANIENAADADAANAPAASASATYRNRNSDKRRAYMRELMRKRRAAQTR